VDPKAAQLYADESGIESKIGAAIYQMDIDITRLQHLGSETQYNVFAAELTAMCLFARIIQDDTHK
jgi:hypothetical protein